MAPVNGVFIKSAYEGAKVLEGGLRTVSSLVNVVKKAATASDLGLTDLVLGCLERFVSWLLGKWLSDAKDSVLLACLVHLEYAFRNGLSFDSAWRSSCLKNKCSKCGLKGHNAQNHDDDLHSYLQNVGLLGDVSDGMDLVAGGD
eukprot:754553-Hanusia_phi.AAC.1